ncbi:MAG: hypothetical protein DYG89_04150 [Caldilinea sp. CFX5]|nr:hypothetical protein [Caldilinea sp. CFX5]
MAVVITPADLGTTLAVQSGKVEVSFDSSLQKDASGKLGIAAGAIPPETPLTVGPTQPAFLTITPSGTNGHVITITANWADPAFIEAVQDAVGQAILAAAGGTLVYDDVANTIKTAMANLGFPLSIKKNADDTVTLVNDAAAPGNSKYYGTDAAGVKGYHDLPPSGVSSDAGNYLVDGTDGKAYLGPGRTLVDVTDLAGNHLYYGLP